MDYVIRTTRNRILAHQKADGSFSFCCEVSPVSDAVMVIFMSLLGFSSDPLIPELCGALASQQKPDGGWTAYSGQDASNSVTVLVYLALLLSGVPKTAPNMIRARRYIQNHGGITQVSTFVKAFLAVTGELPWGILPEPRIEMVQWETADPIDLFDIASPARLHLPSTLILSHLNFSYHLPESMSLRDLVAQGESLPKRRISHVNTQAVARCKTFLLERLEPSGTLAGYLSATVMMVFSFQALGYSNRHPIILRAIASLKDMVYRTKTFVHQQFFTSTVWDTALSMQSLLAAGVSAVHDPMMRGATYLLRKQHRRVSDWIHHAPDAKSGGFGFSHTNPSIQRALAWLESIQNPDGGFGESCASDVRGSYVPLKQSTSSQTAWALMAMRTASRKMTSHIEAAANYLIETARPVGGVEGSLSYRCWCRRPSLHSLPQLSLYLAAHSAL